MERRLTECDLCGATDDGGKTGSMDLRGAALVLRPKGTRRQGPMDLCGTCIASLGEWMASRKPASAPPVGDTTATAAAPAAAPVATPVADPVASQPAAAPAPAPVTTATPTPSPAPTATVVKIKPMAPVTSSPAPTA